jgi:hypothetical protein
MTKRRLSLVPGGALRRLVRAAVARSLAERDDPELTDRLVREIARAIKSAGRPIEGMTKSDVIDELERSRDALRRARERASAELDELRGSEPAPSADAEVREGAADAARAPVADELAELRSREALAAVDEAFERARRERLSSAALRDRIRAVVAEATRRERRELVRELRAAHERRVDLLVRRIAKLNRSLEEAESVQAALAAARHADAGLASVYRTVQGLDDDAPFARQKQELLEQIFLANVALRALIEEEGGDAAGFELPRPVAADPAHA